MLSRRSLFSLFAGAGAIAAGAKVEARPVWTPASDPTPRPDHYVMPERQRFDIMQSEMPSHTHCYTTAPCDATHLHTYSPVNVRSDGTLIHRQHHPVDFPPKR